MAIENNDGAAPPTDMEQVLENHITEVKTRQSQELLGSLVQTEQYVGEVYGDYIQC